MDSRENVGQFHYMVWWYTLILKLTNVHTFTDSPGYLLMSDSDSLSYYFTLSATLEAVGHGSVESQQLIKADGISGNTIIVTWILINTNNNWLLERHLH